MPQTIKKSRALRSLQESHAILIGMRQKIGHLLYCLPREGGGCLECENIRLVFERTAPQEVAEHAVAEGMRAIAVQALRESQHEPLAELIGMEVTDNRGPKP